MAEDFEEGSMDPVFEIPKELALKLLDYHGGQWSPLYSIGSRAVAGEKVDRHHMEDAIRELDDFTSEDEDAEGEAVALMTILQGILDGEDVSEEIALLTEDYDEEDEPDYDFDDEEEEDFDEEDSEEL